MLPSDLKKIRMTHPSMTVLAVLLNNTHTGLSGADIAKNSRLLSGTIYPILHRLERAGWVVSEQEQIDPREVGRPRRRFYKLKGSAQKVALDELNKRRFFGENIPIPTGDFNVT